MNSNSLINIQNSSQLNGQNGALNGPNNLSNGLNSSLNNSLSNLNSLNNSNGSNGATNQRNANKNQQTLPTIYESNHYKETDLQTLFNNFTSKNVSDDRPPLPPDPPPSSSSYSNGKLISFNVLPSASIYHHQPSAVLKQLPTANDSVEETNKVADKSADKNIDKSTDKNEDKNDAAIQSNDLQLDSTPETPANQIASEPPSTEPAERADGKSLKIENLQTKFEEEITIYQRPVPLPGRLMKSSSLEDLFKIRVCKLNPLCLNSDPSKAIIFCANPGPLARIKQSGKSSIESQNHNRPEKSEGRADVKESDEKMTESDAPNAVVNGNSGFNSNTGSDSGANPGSDKNASNEDTTDDQNKENHQEDHPDDESKEEGENNSLNTAIAASFKGFLGDLQACKQHQLALSTFRPLSNTVQHSTGITGTLNTSSTHSQANTQPTKPDPAVEQINTMPNPFSFTKRKQSMSSCAQQSDSQDEQPSRPEQPDITDLLKEFDVCFGDDGANDLISFSNENRNVLQGNNASNSISNNSNINNGNSCSISNNSNTNNISNNIANCPTTDQLGLDFDSDHSFNLPPPPPSLLNSTNSSVNVCPSNHFVNPTNNSASNLTSNSNGTSNGHSNGSTVNGSCFTSNPHVDQQCNLTKPTSSESLQYNESFAKLLDQTALKKASLGPATLETCGSKIQLTELDLSEY